MNSSYLDLSRHLLVTILLMLFIKVLSNALDAAGRKLNRRKLLMMIQRMSNYDIGIGKNLSFGSLDHSGLDSVYYSRLGSDDVFSVFDPDADNSDVPE